MKKVVIIGLGIMGTGIKKSLEAQYQTIGIGRGDSLEVVKDAHIIVIAVKPQSFLALSQDLKHFLDKQIVLSIMAGITCDKISKNLNTTQVVRAMPNLGLSNNKSVTGVYSVNKKNIQAIHTMLRLWGSVVWLKSEDNFHGFTAIADSGPAYFFELTHQLELAALQLGFETKTARHIANNTLVSAAAVIGSESAAEKTKHVASKGGVTEVALAVLAEYGFGNVVSDAVMTSIVKSWELAS